VPELPDILVYLDALRPRSFDPPADRSLSRLLKKDWPRSIEQLESGQSACQ
jgi:hypothetical protein